MAYETPLSDSSEKLYSHQELYETVLFGAKKLNKHERENLILNLVPNDKIEPVLNALGYKLTVLNPDKPNEQGERDGN